MTKLKKEVTCAEYGEEKDGIKYENEPYHTVFREYEGLVEDAKDLEGELERVEIGFYCSALINYLTVNKFIAQRNELEELSKEYRRLDKHHDIDVKEMIQKGKTIKKLSRMNKGIKIKFEKENKTREEVESRRKRSRHGLS